MKKNSRIIHSRSSLLSQNFRCNLWKNDLKSSKKLQTSNYSVMLRFEQYRAITKLLSKIFWAYLGQKWHFSKM